MLAIVSLPGCGGKTPPAASPPPAAPATGGPTAAALPPPTTDPPEEIAAALEFQMTPDDELAIEPIIAEVDKLWLASPQSPLPVDLKTPSSEERKKREFEWIRERYTLAFEKYGRRGPHFDEAARLVHDCTSLPFSRREGIELFLRGQKLLAGGYDDPMLRFVVSACIDSEDTLTLGHKLDLLAPACRALAESKYPPAITYKIHLGYYWAGQKWSLPALEDLARKNGQYPMPNDEALRAIADLARWLSEELDDEDRRFLLASLSREIGASLVAHVDRLFVRLKNTPGVDPWLYQMLRAREHDRRGRLCRDTGDTEGFRLQEIKARCFLLEAWKARPNLPEAAGDLIGITMAIGGVSGETPRFWFDQAVTGTQEVRSDGTRIYLTGVLRCWDAESLEEVPDFSGLE